jgi:putative tryptophan/tyrosine transport system substrate-binding protein
MKRREFIAGTVTTAAMGIAQPICAQINASPPLAKRIVIFHPTEPPAGLTINGRRAYKTYFGELNRLGYIEGQNLIVERYSALGQSDRYGDLARDIVASHPDLIVSVSGLLARLLKSLTATIPILATSADPIAAGLVTNLANPDGNITGVSADAGLEVNGKRLQFLSETARSLSNVRFLSPASGERMSEATIAVVREAARGQTAITIAPAILDGKMDREAYERAFDAMEKDRVDGLIVSDSPEHLTNRQLIVDLAARHRLPAVYPFREFVEVGGLLSYGVDTADLMRRLADMTGQVLGGAEPHEIPFQQQTKFELVLNRKATASLGLEFPATMLAIADEVIG